MAQPSYAGGMVPGIPRVPNDLRRQREMIGWRYYDSVQLVANTAFNSYKFFSNPQGKTPFQTNLTTQAYLPKDELFEIRAISFVFYPTLLDLINITGQATLSLAAQFWGEYEMGHWTIQIGDKSYNKGTLVEAITKQTEYVADVHQAAAADHLALIQQSDNPFFKASGVYPLDVPMTLDGGMPFSVDLTMNNAVTPAVGMNKHLYLFCYLFGRRERRAIG